MIKLKTILFESNTDSRLNDSNTLYIRFGKFGKSGSTIKLDDEFRREVLAGKTQESGLSVYFLRMNDGVYVVVPPSTRRAAYQFGSNYFGNMLETGLAKEIATGNVYVVKGSLIPIEEHDEDSDETYTTFEVGSDGEPLLEPSTVTVVKQLTTEEVLNNVGYAYPNNLIGNYNLQGKPLKTRLNDFLPYYGEEDIKDTQYIVKEFYEEVVYGDDKQNALNNFKTQVQGLEFDSEVFQKALLEFINNLEQNQTTDLETVFEPVEEDLQDYTTELYRLKSKLDSIQKRYIKS